jgi:5'(3')-deoxyribonucleotidase
VEVTVHIFLDMDGVLCDFVGSAAAVFGKGADKLDWPTDRSSVHVPLGLKDEAEMWEKIDGLGHTFWESLYAYPWAWNLWDLCKEMGRVTIATKCSRDPGSAFGKIRWLQKFVGHHFRDYIILATDKRFLSAPGRVLIDDHERHVAEWRQHGGDAILFPQPWNVRRGWSVSAGKDPLAYVKDILWTWKAEKR